jgi:hypothetical protein
LSIKILQRGEKLARRYFQLKMDSDAYNGLKLRAKRLGIPIGGLVENLIGNLELRLKEAYQVLGIPQEKADKVLQMDELLLRTLLELPLVAGEELKEALGRITTTTTTTTTTKTRYNTTTTTIPFTPNIKF